MVSSLKLWATDGFCRRGLCHHTQICIAVGADSGEAWNALAALWADSLIRLRARGRRCLRPSLAGVIRAKQTHGLGIGERFGRLSLARPRRLRNPYADTAARTSHLSPGVPHVSFQNMSVAACKSNGHCCAPHAEVMLAVSRSRTCAAKPPFSIRY